MMTPNYRLEDASTGNRIPFEMWADNPEDIHQAAEIRSRGRVLKIINLQTNELEAIYKNGRRIDC